MDQNVHFRNLERMYQAAPINAFYRPSMIVEAARATIKISADEKLHHSAGAVHGSVYFKMLDDAAFFAANSLEFNVFVLTSSFTTYLTRPVSLGPLRAVGRVVNQTHSQFICESVLYDADSNEVGRGHGVFVRGRLPLVEAMGYADQTDSSLKS